MDVSIVIPTKNGGHLFEKVLDAVFKQKTEYEYEVICVDSGSKDEKLWCFQRKWNVYHLYYAGCASGDRYLAAEFH